MVTGTGGDFVSSRCGREKGGVSIFMIFRRPTEFSKLSASLRTITLHGVSDPDSISGMQVLQDSFRELARLVGFCVAARIALSQLDRVVWASSRLDDIALSVVRLVRLITGARSALFLWVTAQSDRHALVCADGIESTEKFSQISSAEAIKLLALLPTQPASNWRLPAGAFPRRHFLHQDDSQAVFPLITASGVRGALIFGHAMTFTLELEYLDILREIANRILVTDRRVEQSRLFQRMARTDALTGVSNRYVFEGQLAAAIVEAKRQKSEIAILYLDIDRFRQANDFLGRANADLLMKQVARRIRANLATDSVFARVGDDEFAIIEEMAPSQQSATVTARQIITALSHRFEVNGIRVFVGGSIGISLYPKDAATPADLLRNAEVAMYRAKMEGRSRIAYFDPELANYDRQRAAMYSELRDALSSREFVLHYQPLVDLQTGRVTAVETLLRWRHPTRGLLSPDTFLPLAEELGLMDSIGTLVLEEACAQHQRWRRDGIPIPRIAVNVSISQMRRSRFVQTVRSIMAATGMPRGALEIEATESVFLQGEKSAQDAMYALAASGVLFTIDDFGTGYSSFANLLSVPAHTIKLDRSFLQDIHPENDRATIIAGMINMAHAMKKEVVAEGIENEGQLSLLVSLGCDTGQGYHLFRPSPADKVAAFAMQQSLGMQIVSTNDSANPVANIGTFPTSQVEDDWLTVPLEIN